MQTHVINLYLDYSYFRKRMMKKIVTIFLFVLINIHADSEAKQYAKFFNSNNGRYIFKIIPKNPDDEKLTTVGDHKAFGVCYGIGKNSEIIELWKISG